MGRRSPSKNKTSQNRAPIAHRSSSLASEITTPGTLAATLDSVNAPRLEPITTEEQSSPTKNVLRSPTKPLSNQLSTLQQEKEALDNKLWETTVELQEHIQQKKADDSQISRLQSELNKLKSDHEMEFEYLESLKSREAELQAALQSANSLATQEKKSFLEKLESRDEYIEGLQEQIEGYRSKVRSLTQSMASKHQESAAQLSVNTDNSNSSLNADTSIELNFDGSKIPNTPGSSELLSAGRQKRQLITLRNQLQKQRLENHRLRKQVAELNGNPEPSLDSIDSDPESIIESHDTTSTSILGAPELNFSGGFALSDDMVNLDELGQEKIQETQQPEIPETLHSQARAFNHALVPLAEYEELSSREPVRENSIDFEELKRLAAQLNFSVMPNEEFEHINRLLHGDKSIKTQVESHVLQDLVRQNTIEIRSPSRKLANDSSYTADEIAAAAASLGLAILPAKQLERLQSDIQKLHTHQPPAAAEVAQIAKLAGLQVIPENPTVDELRQVISDDVVLVERDVYEALEKPGPATLTRLASTYNLVVMPKSEVEQLRAQLKNHGSTNETTDADNTNSNDLVSVSDLSNTALREAAEKKNLVVLSAEDYQKMLSIRSSRDFNNLPMAERTDFFEKLIRSQGSASSSPSSRQSPSSFGTMADRAGRMGLVLVTKDEYTQLKQSQEMYNPTKADVIKSAKEHGLATMPMDEYSKLRATKWSSPNKTKSTESSPSKPKTTDTKEEDEFKAVPAVYLRALQRIAENPSLTDIESIAKKAGVHIVESSESQAVILAKAEEYGLSQPLSDEELLEKAKLLGLVEPLSLVKILDIAATNGWAPILPRDDLISKAKEFGLIEPPTENTYRREARKLGLIDPTDEEELIERARSLGFVHKPSEQETVEEAKRLGLVAPLTDEEIIERAKSLGLVNNPTESEVLNRAKALGLVDKPSESNILDEAKRLGLVAPLTDDEIIERAKSLGLVNNPTESDVLNRARALGLVDKPSESNIRDEAKRLGLVAPLTDDEIIERAKSLGLVNNPTESEVLNRAKALGLVDKPSESNIRDEAKRLGLVAPLTNDEIIERAKTLGLVSKPTEKEIIDRAKTLGLVEKPSEKNVIDKAKRLGLVAPLTDDGIIERAKTLGLVSKPTESEVIDHAKTLGLVKSPTDDEIIKQAKTLGLVTPLTGDEVIQRAKTLGLVDKPSEKNIIDEAKHLGLVPPLTGEDVIERSKALGMIRKPTENEVISHAKALGLVERPSEKNIRYEAKRLGLVEPLTDSEVMERAKTLGLIERPSEKNILDQAKLLGLATPLTDDEIIKRAKSLGLVDKPSKQNTLDEAKNLGLITPPTDDDIIQMAQNLGLSTPLTDNEIIERAKNLGMTDIRSEYEHSKSVVLVDKLDDNQPGTNSKSPMLSAKDSKNSRGGHSAKLQFESSDQKLAESRPEYSKSKPDSEENSGTSKHHNVAEAKKRDSNQSKLDYEPQDTSTRLNLESEEADVFLTKDRPSKVAAASIAPRQLSNHYKSSKAPSSVHEESKLSDSSQDTAVHASHDTKKGADDREAKLPHKYSVNIRRTNTNSSLSREHNILSTPSAPREHNIAMQSRNTPRTTHRRVDSQSTGSDIDVLGLPMPGTIGGSGAGRKNTGLSENTLSTWSLKSLSSDDIGQFLAQVIMGEVLYKYYGGLNFEGITGGRHRRYFWFRPETRLLYWNRENPQILGYGNPRSITVVQVDEQIDRNPLPAGLFHRTLIIKGIERDIRVTCSTQSRHYVWLMTLRHVLSQNKNSS